MGGVGCTMCSRRHCPNAHNFDTNATSRQHQHCILTMLMLTPHPDDTAITSRRRRHRILTTLTLLPSLL